MKGEQMKDREWINQLVSWLEEFSWQWFTTLTVRPGFSFRQAYGRVLQWAEELSDTLGTRDVRWICFPENGMTTGSNLHFHLVIGGLRKGCGAAERAAWMRYWSKLAGDAQIEDHKPGAEGVRYVLDQIEPRDVSHLELHVMYPRQVQVLPTSKGTSDADELEAVKSEDDF
jgi:hypothetical protein